ncbi:MAG: DUF1385 domain-containing protein [Bacillota bacterium]|nr:DUF1385 domain-containing protein [Bacillota bacterium]
MRKTSIGGEALIEGVMMRGPENIAIAVRKPDGEITVDKKPLQTLAMRHKFFKLPIVRGAVGLFESMVLGVRSLMFSAEFVELDEGEQSQSRFDRFVERVFGDKMKDAVVYFSVIVAMAFAVGFFILLPNLLAGLMDFNKKSTGGVISYNLFEGLLRIAIFVGYIALISKMKDVERVFQYHGAEHKTIHCYEHEEELTVENVRKYTTKHPRCGTAFLFVVMIISILVFSFTGWGSVLVNIAVRLLLLPVVAGLSYEVIKFAGRSDWKIMKIVSAPGLALQHFTTREPDDSQMEVAIEALKNVLVEDKNADRW